MKITIPYNYVPRDYQRGFFNSIADGFRRILAIWHRRSGKDKSAWNLMIKEALKKVALYFYVFPTYRQGKKILWEGIDEDGFRFLEHIPTDLIKGEVNNTEMKINLKNGSMIQIVGADDPNTLRGTNPYGIVLSEFSYMNGSIWSDILTHILAKNGGWAAFLFTPFGYNDAYDLYLKVMKDKNWLVEVIKNSDTKLIRQEEIDKMLSEGIQKEIIAQELECSFESAMPGAYFSNEIQKMVEDKQICGVPIYTNIPVHTFWDLGFDDYNTILFVQFVGREIHIVDAYGDCGLAINHYANYLNNWKTENKAFLGKTVLPHDSINKSLQTGFSTFDILKGYGFECDFAKRPDTKYMGVEAVRQLFSRVWIDEKRCETFIKALKQYRKSLNVINKKFSVKPVDDWTTHYADALQTLAFYTGINWNTINVLKKPQIDFSKYNFSRSSNMQNSWMGI